MDDTRLVDESDFTEFIPSFLYSRFVLPQCHDFIPHPNLVAQ